MKEDLDLRIKEKRKKQDEFATFISAIEKIPILNDKNLALHQGNKFIDVYKTFFDNKYERCIKEILTLSIAGTPSTAYNFAQWYLGVTDTDKT